MTSTTIPGGPSTPPNTDRSPAPPPNRRLWSSPAFSDYFSGGDGEDTFSPSDWRKPADCTITTMTMADSASSFDRSAGGSDSRNHHSSIDRNLSSACQSQRIILARLNNVAKSILRATDLTEHHCQLLDADLDRLEQTLSAPDAQTREPADIADSGLFVDDDDDDVNVETMEDIAKQGHITEESEESASDDLNGALEDTERVGIVDAVETTETRETIARILKVANELHLRYEEMKHIHDLATSKLEASAGEISHLEGENTGLRDELAQTESDMLYLKLELKSIEVRSSSQLDPAATKRLSEDIEQWKKEWKKTAVRVRGRKEGTAERGFDDNASINSDFSSMPGGRRLIISRNSGSRPGESKGARQNGDAEDSFAAEFDGFADVEDEEGESEDRTPWQELWDGIAAFAGVQEGLDD